MIPEIQIQEYNYSLPEERIAKFPLKQRDRSKLLVYKNGEITEDTFNRLHRFLPENSLLVFNNTKVIRARLLFEKATGAQIEIFCLEPYSPSDYALIFAQQQECVWTCMIGNAKKWKEGPLLKEVAFNDKIIKISAEKTGKESDTYRVAFRWDNPEVDFADLLELLGELPIPPYLNRKTEKEDLETYQTVYSKINGSVAAPTAGLHFTEEVLERLAQKGIEREEVTLHVGAGTFKPVKTETIDQHVMHNEFFTIKKSTIEKLLNEDKYVIAVGTTSVRSLESLYYAGVWLHDHPDVRPEIINIDQWTPYSSENNRLSLSESLTTILESMEQSNMETLRCYTRILIAPGYRFKLVKGMITNFHQPQSTLLLLVSAFLRGNWKIIYDYALTHDFRFLSYGDSSLLLSE